MTDKPLVGKVAIVTGGGTGIGRAIAMTLAANGASVAVAGRTVATVEKVASAIEKAGGKAAAMPTDVGVEAECVALVAQTVKKFGRLDILVNNATFTGTGPMKAERTALEMPVEEWKASFAVNVLGPIVLSRESVPHMKKQDKAFIVNIGAIGTRFGYPGMGIYSAVKNANRAAMIVLSKELRKTSGIRVHIVNPGGVASDRFQDAINAGTIRPDLKGSKMIPPQDIADAILFLVTRNTNGMVDEISVRREDADYYCYP
jgi:fengycin family lipopeptide synthetase B